MQDLKNAMPGYDYIGVGRDDGKQAGEHSAIFYRKEKNKKVKPVCLSRNLPHVQIRGRTASHPLLGRSVIVDNQKSP